MHQILTFLLVCLAFPLSADPGDPWEGIIQDVIEEVEGDGFRVDVAARLLPEGASTLTLLYRNGSRPGGTVSPNPPEMPQTTSDLRPDLPGNLGFWTVHHDGQAIGAISLNQNPGSYAARGRLGVPRLANGRVARINCN